MVQHLIYLSINDTFNHFYKFHSIILQVLWVALVAKWSGMWNKSDSLPPHRLFRNLNNSDTNFVRLWTLFLSQFWRYTILFGVRALKIEWNPFPCQCRNLCLSACTVAYITDYCQLLSLVLCMLPADTELLSVIWFCSQLLLVVIVAK